MPANTILVADDDPKVTEFVRRVLGRVGYEVFACHNPFELPQLVTKHKPALVMLDVNMPALKGTTALLMLRNMSATSGCRIALHSGEDEATLRELGKHVGADGVIPKGLTVAEFLIQVRALLPPE